MKSQCKYDIDNRNRKPRKNASQSVGSSSYGLHGIDYTEYCMDLLRSF